MRKPHWFISRCGQHKNLTYYVVALLVLTAAGPPYQKVKDVFEVDSELAYRPTECTLDASTLLLPCCEQSLGKDSAPLNLSIQIIHKRTSLWRRYSGITRDINCQYIGRTKYPELLYNWMIGPMYCKPSLRSLRWRDHQMDS
jgi:hypothetical protein